MLDKILWFVPHVIPADAEKFFIYKTVESKVKLPVAYKTRQCDMFSVPESTSFIWQMSIKTSPENRDISLLASKQQKMEMNQKTLRLLSYQPRKCLCNA